MQRIGDKQEEPVCLHVRCLSAAACLRHAKVLFINFVLSDGTTGETSFLVFQVFHFLLYMSFKLRACIRMNAEARIKPCSPSAYSTSA